MSELFEIPILDYRKAVELDSEMGEDPDWITLFLRNISIVHGNLLFYLLKLANKLGQH